MANNSSLPGFISCGYNWTGPVMGKTAPLSTDSQMIGYISCVIAAVLLGSNFVPLKFIKTGDGFFCQWVMSGTIFITGLVMQLIREQPIFFPENILGGIFWKIANCFVVPVINLIGLSLGMLVWTCTNVLVGWATGRFGMFGLCDQIPKNEILNYVGVALCLCSGFVLVFVKTETKVTLPKCLRRKEPETNNFQLRISVDSNATSNRACVEPLVSGQRQPEPGEVASIFLPNLPPLTRRILGVVLALISGCCYGVQFLPTNYIQNHYTVKGVRASQNGLDYVFAQYSGIFASSTVFFLVYAVIYRRTSFIDRGIILPAALCGIIWGIATFCFFLANSTLSPAITYPIITTVPGMIGALYGTFLFGEIRGLRNFLILGVAFSLTISGAILTAFSK